MLLLSAPLSAALLRFVTVYPDWPVDLAAHRIPNPRVIVHLFSSATTDPC